MRVTDVLNELRSRGKPSVARIYRMHGIKDETLGVSNADLDCVARNTPRNLELCLGLWHTGIHEARVLATRLADPAFLEPTTVEDWMDAASNYVITDALAGLASRMPDPIGIARNWIDSAGEWRCAGGWNIVASLALQGGLERGDAHRHIERIADEIHHRPNRTRHAMNNALIAIGGSDPAVRDIALAAAASIGKVDVDHGRTGCVTPDATSYIGRMAARPSRRSIAKAAP